ncbi:MAG TPA: hypothetical protein VEN29_04245, partial [Casimicrobiaceae bacterium]|nr:hypothetical protein [Casimicrobiaceae bacterium]
RERSAGAGPSSIPDSTTKRDMFLPSAPTAAFRREEHQARSKGASAAQAPLVEQSSTSFPAAGLPADGRFAASNEITVHRSQH